MLNILSQTTASELYVIADVGCGNGLASSSLAGFCQVVGFDIRVNPLPSANDPAIAKAEFVKSQAEHLPSRSGAFDCVILMDVIEHVENPARVLKSTYDALKKDGLLYISTPNRFSPLNVINDPHYSLPFISLCKRKLVRKIVADMLGWHEHDKRDFAELFSYKKLSSLLSQCGFQWKFVNNQVFKYALKNPGSLWSRSWHIAFVELCKRMRLDALFIKVVNDNRHIFNKWLNPAWFIIANK